MLAAFTDRHGGVSAPPFDSLNLGSHVGDAPTAVAENRARLRAGLELHQEPRWLQQTHGTHLVNAGTTAPGDVPAADASWTEKKDVPCVVMTADCLPVLLCRDDGQAVAAVHAGWRGIAAGILTTVLSQLPGPARHWLAWLGPAIGPQAFEVGAEVHAAMMSLGRDYESGFRWQAERGRYLLDLYAVARTQLAQAGVESVVGGHYCTWSDARFFSFRRDGVTGRMAALIWRR